MNGALNVWRCVDFFISKEVEFDIDLLKKQRQPKEHRNEEDKEKLPVTITTPNKHSVTFLLSMGLLCHPVYS